MEQVLVFRLGEELYGLEISHIQEVVETPAFHYIPRAPAFWRGAINFHGSILPVLDLPDYLGFSDRERDHRVIALVPDLCPLALAVSAIRRIIPVDPELLLPFRQESEEKRYIRAVFNREDEMVNLLDVVQLLASFE